MLAFSLLSTFHPYPLRLKNSYSLLGWVLLLLASALPASAQLLTPQLRSALQAELNRLPPHFGIKGVAAAVRLPDGSVWEGAAGVSTVTPLDSLRPDMLFGAASLTKTFTAALTLRLVEQGYMGLDDSIAPHLPVWARIPAVNPTRVTVRQLLCHTHGLAEYTAAPGFASALATTPGRLFTAADLLGFVLPPTAVPGTRFQYSNTGYFLLGLIIEHKYQIPLATALRRVIWTPSRLDETFMGYETLPAGLEQAHGWATSSPPPIDMNLSSRTALFTGYNAAGGSVSTVNNLARWGKILFGGQLLSPATVQQMQTLVQLSAGNITQFGMGCSPIPLGVRTGWGHYGFVTGCLAAFAYEPHCDISISLVFNDDSQPTLRPLILNTLYNIVQQATCPRPMGQAGLAETLLAPTLSPNPATGSSLLTFACPPGTRALDVSLFDATGRVVRTFSLDPAHLTHDLSLTGLPAGVYQARLLLDDALAADDAVGVRLMVLP